MSNLSPVICDAARDLRLTVTRFLADRASLAEIEDALAMLRTAVHAAPVVQVRKGRR